MVDVTTLVPMFGETVLSSLEEMDEMVVGGMTNLQFMKIAERGDFANLQERLDLSQKNPQLLRSAAPKPSCDAPIPLTSQNNSSVRQKKTPVFAKKNSRSAGAIAPSHCQVTYPLAALGRTAVLLWTV